MEFQEINLIIDPDGRVHIEVRGAKGLECLELTRPLEEALGGQVEERTMTPDAYEQPAAQPLSSEEQERKRRK